MPGGVIVFGANGSGKSTFGRALARAVGFLYMDIEAYHFMQSEIPYTRQRPREDCINLMLADMRKHPSFVLSAVTGDFGEEIAAMYGLAIWMSAPRETRIERVKQRVYEQYGPRVLKGGDMYEQQSKFVDFVASRSLRKIEDWAESLACPVIRIDGTRPVSENIALVAKKIIWNKL